MLIRDIFVHDPLVTELVNNGWASVGDITSVGELETLRYELATFVCEGQYEDGLGRMLESYLANLDKPQQLAAWVSGFYGSGKSHLVKMLRYLWADFTFPDGSTARGLVRVPSRIKDLLRELDTAGKRHGGLHAAGGTVGQGGSSSVRMALLGVVFKSKSLPERYPQARFVMWLNRQGALDAVKASVARQGKVFDLELSELYVSPVLARAVLDALPGFAASEAEVRSAIRSQFPAVTDVSLDEMVQALQDALGNGGQLPCTVIVLDEVQQWIAEDRQRSYDVQEVTETCCKKLGARLLFVGTGQSVLSATPALQRLQDRFKIPVQLSDSDVEKVVRTIVLAKKPDHAKAVESTLTQCSGEISRHLVGTKIEPCTEDTVQILLADYPLLPTRRRFWEKVLRAVDTGGKAGQLRTQLTIVHEAVRALGERPLGTVVAGDVVYDAQKTSLVQTGVLPRELYELIEGLRDGTEDGTLRARLCALIFLIGKLPREKGADLGARATSTTLADLLVEDLTAGSAQLRKRIEALLEAMAAEGKLLLVESEYRLQTRESAAWEADFRERERRILGDDQALASYRADLLRVEALSRLKTIRLSQGTSKQPRKIEPQHGGDKPKGEGPGIPVWVRDGWGDDEKAVLEEARRAGTDSPVVFVFLPRRSAELLKKTLATNHAARETLQVRGAPTSDEGQHASAGMESRQMAAEQQVATLVSDIFAGARVWLGGGSEVPGVTFEAAVEDAASSAVVRLFPQFGLADHDRWGDVVDRVRKGAGNALEVVGHKGDPETHRVCAAILKALGPGKKGSELRKLLSASPYGWPQDAVDGAALVLIHSGKIQARHDGRPADARQLDQSKLATTELRPVARPVTAKEKVALRLAFQEAGLSCKPGEEATVAPVYLARLLELASGASGDEPAPARPDTTDLKELQGLVGNDLLVALADRIDTLKARRAEWAARGKLVAERRPPWEALQRLLAHAEDLPVAAQARPQVEAINATRALLADPDPVSPLTAALAGTLRHALADEHGACCTAHEAGQQVLGRSDIWAKLDEATRADVLARCQVSAVPAIAVGTDEELLATLDTMPLAQWRNLRDALPQRFANALAEAAKLLEPKAVRVTLPSATIRTAEDLESWLEESERRISERLKDGPVLV